MLAFQKWERLGGTGLVDGRTKARLACRRARPVHPRRSRQARRDPARPPGRAADQRQRACGRSQSRAESPRHRPRRATPRLRQDPALVVGAVPRVAAVGAAVRGRDRVPRVREVPTSPPRTAASASPPSPAGHTTSPRRHAGQGDRPVVTDEFVRAAPACHSVLQDPHESSGLGRGGWPMMNVMV